MKGKSGLIIIYFFIFNIFIFSWKINNLIANEVITWKLQTAYPLSSSVTNHATHWAKSIEKISNGRIKIELHPDGTFCSASDMITFLNRGTFDAAITYGGYYVGKLPEANLEACIPMAFRNHFEVWDFMYPRGFQEIIQESYSKLGVRYWGAPSDCYYGIATTFPINTIDDLKGKKIRATGLIGKFLEKLGASVTVIPGSELYMALKLGTIDGAVYGGGTILKENMHEVIKYWVNYPTLGHTNAALLVSNKSIDKLPDDLKAIVENATQYILLDSALQYLKESEDMVIKLESLGPKMVLLPESDVQKMTEIAMIIWDEMAKENQASEKGIKILKEQLKYYGRIK